MAEVDKINITIDRLQETPDGVENWKSIFLALLSRQKRLLDPETSHESYTSHTRA